MQAYVSLWSADLLALGEAVDLVDDLVTGYHIDVFDGHNVPDLLFGPDLVAALRRRTAVTIDIHLNVTEPDYWVGRFADAGADLITVQSGACTDVDATLALIRERGCRAGLGLEVHEAVDVAAERFGAVDRVLTMGTPIGVKGLDLDPAAPQRVRDLVAARGADGPTVVVDGGIRRTTVPRLAEAGADGVVPGNLVFGAPDPRAALTALAGLTPGRPVPPDAAFWSEQPQATP